MSEYKKKVVKFSKTCYTERHGEISTAKFIYAGTAERNNDKKKSYSKFHGCYSPRDEVNYYPVSYTHLDVYKRQLQQSAM